MIYDLPTCMEVGGATYEIRSDYRAVLDLCAALSDPELDNQEKGFAALTIFYPNFGEMPAEDYQEALEKCFWFINCGDDERSDKSPLKLLDWEQDFKYIVAPINRVLGKEARAMEYLHWWTFISAYYEIGGDCTFAQIVRIREKKAKGKPLDKQEQAWYRQNRSLVDFRTNYTKAEDDVLKQWGAC